MLPQDFKIEDTTVSASLLDNNGGIEINYSQLPDRLRHVLQGRIGLALRNARIDFTAQFNQPDKAHYNISDMLGESHRPPATLLDIYSVILGELAGIERDPGCLQRDLDRRNEQRALRANASSPLGKAGTESYRRAEDLLSRITEADLAPLIGMHEPRVVRGELKTLLATLFERARGTPVISEAS